MALNEHEVAALALGEALARKDHHFEAIAKAVHHTLEPELELLAWAIALELNMRLYETDEFVSVSVYVAAAAVRSASDVITPAFLLKVAEWLKPPKPPVKVGDEVFLGEDDPPRRVVVIAISGTLAWAQAPETASNMIVPLVELHHS